MAVTNTSNISLKRSEEVHEIMTQVPAWIIRWGITVLFVGVMILLLLSWMFKYPDVVEAGIKINTQYAPASVSTEASGPVEFFVADAAMVEKGEYIALIKSSTEFEDFNLLKQNMDVFPALYQLNENWQLGELQPFFNQLVVLLKRQKNLKEIRSQNTVKNSIIEEQIAEYEAINQENTRKIYSLEKEHDYDKNLLRQRYQPLWQSGNISQKEYEKYAMAVTEKRRNLETARGIINQTNTRILALKREQQELKFQRTNDKTAIKNELDIAYTQLKSQLAIWEQKYLLKAPIAGVLTYLDFNKNNMFLTAQTEIARIIPAGDSRIYGEIFLPANNFGKVDTGQVVHIELFKYQKREFGVLEGKIQAISPISNKNTYKAYVELDNSLITTSQKTVEFNHGMEGKAVIITDEIRLLERFFFQIREALR